MVTILLWLGVYSLRVYKRFILIPYYSFKITLREIAMETEFIYLMNELLFAT